MGTDDDMMVQIGKLLDVKLAGVATEQSIRNLHEDVKKLSKEIVELKNQIRDLKISRIYRYIERLELEACKNNIIIKGLKWGKNDDLTAVAGRFFADILRIT